jgi:hypothetical protein
MKLDLIKNGVEGRRLQAMALDVLMWSRNSMVPKMKGII